MKMYPGATWEAYAANAAWDPLKQTSTNTPYVSRADKELGEGPLYKSKNEQALLTDKMVLPYFGHLPTGLIMGIVPSGDLAGMIFPADFEVTATEASANTIKVAEADAVFFQKGMEVHSGGSTAGKITAIAAAEDGVVSITVDGTASSTDITLPFDHCVVLDQPVFSDERGAYTSAIYSNAVLIKGKMKNFSDDLLEKLGGFVDGPYVIVK